MMDGQKRPLPPTVGRASGGPVLGFGKVYVNQLCPDFETGVVLQEGNEFPQTKIQPKKSWEIEQNRIGICPEQTPRTAEMHNLRCLCINLIDGDHGTEWESRGNAQPDVDPAWIRIDLARETFIREIVLVPREDGQGIPGELSIRVSKDAHHWLTVYETKNQPHPEDGEPLRFPLTNPLRAKQVWIIGNNLPQVEHPLTWVGWEDHRMCLAEVEV